MKHKNKIATYLASYGPQWTLEKHTSIRSRGYSYGESHYARRWQSLVISERGEGYFARMASKRLLPRLAAAHRMPGLSITDNLPRVRIGLDGVRTFLYPDGSAMRCEFGKQIP